MSQDAISESEKAVLEEPEVDINMIMTTGSGQGDLISYHEAINRSESEEWLAAMKQELINHTKARTWRLMDLLSARKRILRGKWVFKTKLNPAGKLIKRKA